MSFLNEIDLDGVCLARTSVVVFYSSWAIPAFPLFNNFRGVNSEAWFDSQAPLQQRLSLLGRATMLNVFQVSDAVNSGLELHRLKRSEQKYMHQAGLRQSAGHRQAA
jgi:hypothetical protein